MIGITRKADYAIRCMLYLAAANDRPQNTLEIIAAETGTPRNFIIKALQEFSKIGLVKSSRGSGGGFALARRPEKISLLEIVEATDGPVVNSSCTDGCRNAKNKRIHNAGSGWHKVQVLVQKRLQEITLKDLAGT